MGERYLTTNFTFDGKELKSMINELNNIPLRYATGGFISPYRYPKVKKIIYNFKNPDKPATIVFWSDSSKTVVKCDTKDFNKEAGLAQCFLKKCLDCSRKDIKKLIDSADIQE